MPSLSNSSSKGLSRRSQSVSRLHLRYGRFLRPEIMHQDPFYTLSELFSVLSYAESQVLDVIEASLARDSWQAIQGDDMEQGARSEQATEAQSNLVYARELLQARISNLTAVLEFIEGHLRRSDAHSYWPHPADQRQKRESDAVARALQLDFEHLNRRAGTLYSRCESAMMLAMNRASIAEAKRSLHQSHIVSRFTVLAFFFIPATATAGMFGMNFRELGTGTHSIWLFFAVVVPLFFITYMFLYDGWQRLWATLKRLYESGVKNLN
jgi:Mg2+ and Co2+ transporter CorA